MSDPSTPDPADVARQMLDLFIDGEPAVIRGLSGLFEAAEVFDWIRSVHPGGHARRSLDKIRALKTVWHMSPPEGPDPTVAHPGRSAELFREGAMLLDAEPYLPRPEHPDLDAWIAATREALGGPFGMQAPGIECASWDALDRLQTLLSPTLALTGPRSYRYNAFVGDYRRTPFGFHIDPHHEAVFQYVVSGRKRAKFWEGLALNERDRYWIEETNGLFEPPGEPQYSFDLEPGDLVFWPGTQVHGFEAEGPSLALSMVIDRSSPRDRNAVLAGLEILSAGGRAALPPISPEAEVRADETITRRASFPLRYERFDDELLVGICGRTFEWPDRLSVPTAMRLFDYLDAHPEVSVAAVIEACADEWLAAEEILGALSMLRAFGYFR